MATATHSSTRKSTTGKAAGKSAAKSTAARGQDAIALLKADHREVEKLFGQFEKAKDEDRKQALADKICLELKVHTQIEEEIFYPAGREYLDDEEMIDEAVVEHAAAKDLIAEIEGMQPSDDLYDAKVTVLQEQIEHHVEEEEKELFPKLKKTDMDMKAVGAQLKSRKAELMAQMDGGQGKAMQ